MRQRQAVARLDLHCGDALGHELLQARQTLLQQFVSAGSAGVFYSGGNAAALAGDVFVAGATQALFKLGSPVAAVNQVGVAVNQAGGDERASGVVCLLALLAQLGWQIGQTPDPAQVLAFNHQRAIFYQSVGFCGLGLQGGQRAVLPKGQRHGVISRSKASLARTCRAVPAGTDCQCRLWWATVIGKSPT